MSQEDVLQILKELGGKATQTEIRDRAKTKYPKSTLYSYISTRLKKLKEWGQIDYAEGKWFIVKRKK